MGFDAKWGVLVANAVGAPHQRERIWIYGSHPSSQRWNNRVADWKERQLLRDKNWDASESKSEREGWFSWVGQVGADVANAQELFGYGGNNNSRISMESKAQSKSGNDCGSCSISNTDSAQCQGMCITERVQQEHANISNPCWWQAEPDVGRMADGVAAGLDRLKAIGNGQVPLCAATAWRILSQ
jgi:DNA (cytosine-5)-methyltransferase 1